MRKGIKRTTLVVGLASIFALSGVIADGRNMDSESPSFHAGNDSDPDDYPTVKKLNWVEQLWRKFSKA